MLCSTCATQCSIWTLGCALCTISCTVQLLVVCIRNCVLTKGVDTVTLYTVHSFLYPLHIVRCTLCPVLCWLYTAYCAQSHGHCALCTVLHTTNYTSKSENRWLCTVCCAPLAVHHWLCTVCCAPLAVHHWLCSCALPDCWDAPIDMLIAAARLDLTGKLRPVSQPTDTGDQMELESGIWSLGLRIEIPIGFRDFNKAVRTHMRLFLYCFAV